MTLHFSTPPDPVIVTERANEFEPRASWSLKHLLPPEAQMVKRL